MVGGIVGDGDESSKAGSSGVEGPTRRTAIEDLRLRQIKNYLASLLLSQGVPMMLMGDECRRTQRGNNNAYCQDNAIAWFDWKLVERNNGLLRFVRELIAFRKKQPTVRRANFLTGQALRPNELPDVNWFGAAGEAIDWVNPGHSLVCLFGASGLDQPTARHVLLMAHSGAAPQEFVIPPVAAHIPWRLFVDTATPTPADIFPLLDGPAPLDGATTLAHHSLKCYVGWSQ